MRKPLGLFGSVVITSLVLAVSARADDVIARLPAATPIDAYHGRIAWSEPSPAGYRLRGYHDGVVRTMPVAPSATPFDVDLGPERHGRTVAVYQRCVRALTAPDYQPPLGCDLYLSDFRRARETPIRHANSKAYDEYYPAIWKGRLVFARPWGFYWRSLTGRGPNHALGHWSDEFFPPSGADLRGNVAALAFGGSNDAGEVKLVRIGGRIRTIPHYPVSKPSIGRRFVYVTTLWGDRYAGYVVGLTRYDRVRESYDGADVPFLKTAAGFDQDGSTSYYLTAEHPPCYGPTPAAPSTYTE